MTSLGYGWRLVAFDPSTRSGEVALGARRLRFESDAAADEDLRVGDDVFVRLFPPADAPHVARVWPCVARLRVPHDVVRAGAPPLSNAIATAAVRTLAYVAVPVELYPVDRGDGRLVLLATDVDRNDYGIAGWDITVRGALACERSRPLGRTAMIPAASVRLALPEERALVHSAATLGADDVVLALAAQREEFSPDAPAEVVLVACESVSWEPGPAYERATAARRALATVAGMALDLSDFAVEQRGLIVTRGDRRERFFELQGSQEVAAFEIWCQAVNAVLRTPRDDD